MGSGSSKGHQSFAVTPTAQPASTPHAVATGSTGEADPAGPFAFEGPDATLEQAAEPGALPEHTGATPALEQAAEPAPSPEPATEPNTAATPAPEQADTEPEPGHGLDAEAPSTPEPASEVQAEPGVHGELPEPAVGNDALLSPEEDIPVGAPFGTATLVGGADLVDGTATLLAYDSPTGEVREMLVAVVDEAAEAKLVEALALGDKAVPAEVEVEAHQRLPLDTQWQLYEQTEKIAKSINHHLKAGSAIPQHTHDNLFALADALDAADNQADSPDEQAMLDHYGAVADAMAKKVVYGYNTPYDEGGKLNHIAPYEVATTATVTKNLPAAAGYDGALETLPTEVRGASRPAPVISPQGHASWDGAGRHQANPDTTEYVADLGDGYTAIYRPYAGNDPKTAEFSLRGSLEVTAPVGTGHGPELVHRLGQLNLVNKPMTQAEGEWTYLQRNIGAQQLGTHPAVVKAQAEAAGLEDAAEQVLLAKRASQAVNLPDSELGVFARQLRLDAEAKALPDKVTLLRDAVATATGYSSGLALAASPSYNPVPDASAGWLTWRRFDVEANRDAIRKAFGDRELVHGITADNLVQVLRTGALASTERRHLMGITGKGLSEGKDKFTGGASSVFLRVKKTGVKPDQCTLHWDDPTAPGLLSNASWYASDSDTFGALNPHSEYDTTSPVRDPFTVAKFKGHSNEVMIRDGIDLLGAGAPSRITCPTTTQREQVLNLLSDIGISHLGGKPVTQVVTLNK